jgi:hypothetical protein
MPHTYPQPARPNCINLTTQQIVKLMQFGRRASFRTRAAGVAEAHPIEEERGNERTDLGGSP